MSLECLERLQFSKTEADIIAEILRNPAYVKYLKILGQQSLDLMANLDSASPEFIALFSKVQGRLEILNELAAYHVEVVVEASE